MESIKKIFVYLFIGVLVGSISTFCICNKYIDRARASEARIRADFESIRINYEEQERIAQQLRVENSRTREDYQKLREDYSKLEKNYRELGVTIAEYRSIIDRIRKTDADTEELIRKLREGIRKL